ncbi:hypothetical protein D3C72_1761820 [compost metagenome]
MAGATATTANAHVVVACRHADGPGTHRLGALACRPREGRSIKPDNAAAVAAWPPIAHASASAQRTTTATAAAHGAGWATSATTASHTSLSAQGTG